MNKHRRLHLYPVALRRSKSATKPSAAVNLELLHHTSSVVAVSSVVSNSSECLEHLIDENLETAWNSRTGDLLGAWLAFRVPPAVQLSAIKLTAGYPWMKPKGICLPDKGVWTSRLRPVGSHRSM